MPCPETLAHELAIKLVSAKKAKKALKQYRRYYKKLLRLQQKQNTGATWELIQ